MPSLPRIKRTRPRSPAGEVVARPEPRLAELQSGGLTWIHLDAPTADEANMLAERFGWHPLDIEDVLSKRQRPKIDEYTEEGYLFGVLHLPVYDKPVQRLNAGELDFFLGPDYLVTLPAVELLPVTRLFRRCECSSGAWSASCPRSSSSTSTTSSTRRSGSGTFWTTTRRSSTGSRTRTSRSSRTARTTSCASSPSSASCSCR